VITSYAENRIRISGIAGGREKSGVKIFLSCIPERLQKRIKAVCCDMYESYISAVKEVSGKKVAVAADRFHVAELYRKDVGTLRESVRFLFSGNETSEKETALERI